MCASFGSLRSVTTPGTQPVGGLGAAGSPAGTCAASPRNARERGSGASGRPPPDRATGSLRRTAHRRAGTTRRAVESARAGLDQAAHVVVTARTAQSCTRPKANAVWLCSPTRIGYRSLGNQRLQALGGLGFQRCQRVDQRCACGSSQVVQFGCEQQQPGEAVRPLERCATWGLQIGDLGRDVRGGEAAGQRRSRLRCKWRAREQPRERSPAASDRAPRNASRSSRRKQASARAAAEHRHRSAACARACSGTRDARSAAQGLRSGRPRLDRDGCRRGRREGCGQRKEDQGASSGGQAPRGLPIRSV